jgi:hypothetical protein
MISGEPTLNLSEPHPEVQAAKQRTRHPGICGELHVPFWDCETVSGPSCERLSDV